MLAIKNPLLNNGPAKCKRRIVAPVLSIHVVYGHGDRPIAAATYSFCHRSLSLSAYVC